MDSMNISKLVYLIFYSVFPTFNPLAKVLRETSVPRGIKCSDSRVLTVEKRNSNRVKVSEVVVKVTAQFSFLGREIGKIDEESGAHVS